MSLYREHRRRRDTLAQVNVMSSFAHTKVEEFTVLVSEFQKG